MIALEKALPNKQELCYKGGPHNPDIKIFVSHRIDKDSATIDNPLYIPVRCGAVFDMREDVAMLGDDTGENISSRRYSFCELTVQYWAWKNVKADYYGLCHYRRYHCFADGDYELGMDEANNGCIVEPSISHKSKIMYGLDEHTMRSVIEKYDIIAHKPIDLTKHSIKSNYEAMRLSPKYHKMSDVDIVIKIIAEKYPHMLNAANEYFDGTKSWLYNCYIMKANLFNEYCSFLFDVLFELEKLMDMTNYTITQTRGPAGIAERLFGVYYTWLKKERATELKFKEVPLVFFNNTDLNAKPKPAFGGNEIVLVSNFNNNYFPIFSVFFESILKHSDPNRTYDYIVLSSDISDENKAIGQRILSGNPNFSLRYYDPKDHFDNIDLFVNNRNYTKDMYYRLIVPYILRDYKKAVVLDVDAVCCCDVAELFDIEISDSYIAAVKDVVYQGWLNGYVSDAQTYARDVLRLKNPFNYCNTGILVMNLEMIRADFSEEYVLGFVNRHPFRVFEQDTINVLYQDHIKFLDPKWNTFTYTSTDIKECAEIAKFEDAIAYFKAREKPAIIHYAAHPKPWVNLYSDFSDQFWLYARLSPFYEKILFNMLSESINTVSQSLPPKDLGPSRVRKFADRIVPKGTRRREFLKKIFPKKGSRAWEFLRKTKNIIAKPFFSNV